MVMQSRWLVQVSERERERESTTKDRIEHGTITIASRTTTNNDNVDDDDDEYGSSHGRDLEGSMGRGRLVSR